MRETGTVMSKDGKTVKVKLGTLEGCSSCVNADCRDNGNEISAYDRRDVNPGIGDRVVVEVSGSKTLKLAAIVLLPGAFLFVAAYVLFSLPGFPSWLRYAGGLTGVALGLSISVILSRASGDDLPVISGVAPPDVYPLDADEDQRV